jgi:hypothetical protein
LQEIADKVRQQFADRKIVFVDGDITDADVRQRTVDTAVAQLGGIDILINNAGVGAMTTERFIASIRDDVCPTLRKGDIAVMDNLLAHKSPCVRCLIEQCKASLFYLPPYSPDLNPIENSFAKEKAMLRKVKIRDVDKLLFF